MPSHSHEENLEAHMRLLQEAVLGRFDNLDCPSCRVATVSVWFSHPGQDEYRTWFLCGNCDFHTRVQNSARPAKFTEDRLKPDLERRDRSISETAKFKAAINSGSVSITGNSEAGNVSVRVRVGDHPTSILIRSRFALPNGLQTWTLLIGKFTGGGVGVRFARNVLLNWGVANCRNGLVPSWRQYALFHEKRPLSEAISERGKRPLSFAQL